MIARMVKSLLAQLLIHHLLYSVIWTRIVFTGIYFTGENIAAVDGCRLAVNKDSALTVEGEFVLSAKSLKLLDTFGNCDLFMEVSPKYVLFVNHENNMQLCIRRIEGNFIKLQNVIPAETSVKEVYTVKTSDF